MGLSVADLVPGCFGRREVRISLVGLDFAGKTSTLYKLKLGQQVAAIPTIGCNFERVAHRRFAFVVADHGGQKKQRQLWNTQTWRSHGVIFVVDSHDHERMAEARVELWRILKEGSLHADAPVLILANKTDLTKRPVESDLVKVLELEKVFKHRWFVQPACACTGEGLFEGLDWLTEALAERAPPWKSLKR